MSALVWFGMVAAVAVAGLAWSLCRAAARMDEAFDALDRELRERESRRATPRSIEEDRPCA